MKIASCIRKRSDNTVQVHAENPYRFAKLEIRRLMFLSWFGSFQCYLAAGRLQLFAETFPFFFHLSSRDVLLAEFAEILHGFVGSLFGIQQDSVSLFVGLADDAVTLVI